jgi:hypothetical protein
MANLIKKVYDFVLDLLWDLSHSAKWDFIFHLVIIFLQLICIGFLIKIYDLFLEVILK